MSKSKELPSADYHIATTGSENPTEWKELEKLFGSIKSLSIYDQNNLSRGTIEYYWDSNGKHWEIEDILVDKGFKRKKLGKALLQVFCQNAGTNQPVHAAIIHEKTLSLLKQRYSDRLVVQSSTLIWGEELKDVPFVRFLESGGIQVDKMTFAKNKKVGRGFSYSTGLWGRTK